MSLGSPGQGSSKRGSHSLRLSGSRGFRGGSSSSLGASFAPRFEHAQAPGQHSSNRGGSQGGHILAEAIELCVVLMRDIIVGYVKWGICVFIVAKRVNSKVSAHS